MFDQNQLLDAHGGTFAPPGERVPTYNGGVPQDLMMTNQFGPNWLRMRRPFLDRHGRPTVTINRGRWTVEKGQRRAVLEDTHIGELARRNWSLPPVVNATSLRKEEWIMLDQVVLRAARFRLRAWADLASSNSFGGFNGMSRLILEHESMSDPGEAVVDMDGITPGRSDQAQFQLRGLPLPITHSDFWVSSRRLAVSRNTGTPIDSTMGEAAGRRVAELIEKTTIGVTTGITYGGNSTQVGGYDINSTVWGYINFTQRLTKNNMTAPTAGGWVPETTQIEVNTCLNILRNNKFYGPFMLYHSNDWDPYLDGDYYVAKTSGAVAPTKTLRERLRAIDGIQDVRRLDFLFGTAPVAGAATATAVSSNRGPGTDTDATLKTYRFIFVQMTPDTAQAVNGMDITTVQWETVGGMQLNFKVMAIQVPRLRADYYGNAGILDATNS